MSIEEIKKKIAELRNHRGEYGYHYMQTYLCDVLEYLLRNKPPADSDNNISEENNDTSEATASGEDFD